MIVYATFTIVTICTIGYIALAVGWLVAKAIMKGSNGIGGRRYQVAAVLLTYAAISLAAVPIGGLNTQSTGNTTTAQQQAANSARRCHRRQCDPAGQQSQPPMNFGRALPGCSSPASHRPFLSCRSRCRRDRPDHTVYRPPDCVADDPVQAACGGRSIQRDRGVASTLSSLSPSVIRQCPNCRHELNLGALDCPECHTLVHGQQAKRDGARGEGVRVEAANSRRRAKCGTAR